MKNVAVFCARTSERNTGMATVDLAAFVELKRISPQATITLYTFGKANEYTYQPGELPYEHLDVVDHEEKYLSSDVFVFWGDFIHCRSYWRLDRGAWDETCRDMSSAEYAAWEKGQFDVYSKYIFLTTIPDSRLKSVIVFGSTIITNDAFDQLDSLYYENFKRFFANVGAVYFRDPLSAAKISPLRSNEPTLSCDCALLLKNVDLEQFSGFRMADHRSGIGVFFGRTPSKLKMMLFAHVVARHLGSRASWLPWFVSRRKFRMLARTVGFRIPPGRTDIGPLLSRLSSHSFIITDTYHLCVNAWRMGIPAICIGEGAGGRATSLGDKKKESLFDMYGAIQFYSFLESVRSIRTFFTEARRVASVLENIPVASQVSGNVALHQDMARRRLTSALLELL